MQCSIIRVMVDVDAAPTRGVRSGLLIEAEVAAYVRVPHCDSSARFARCEYSLHIVCAESVVMSPQYLSLFLCVSPLLLARSFSVCVSSGTGRLVPHDTRPDRAVIIPPTWPACTSSRFVLLYNDAAPTTSFYRSSSRASRTEWSGDINEEAL